MQGQNRRASGQNADRVTTTGRVWHGEDAEARMVERYAYSTAREADRQRVARAHAEGGIPARGLQLCPRATGNARRVGREDAV